MAGRKNSGWERLYTHFFPQFTKQKTLTLAAIKLVAYLRTIPTRHPSSIILIMNSAAIYLTKLHRLLNEYFSLEEIRTLCFNLHIDYESVPGEEKQSRIRELLLGLGRRSRLTDLIPLLQQERPLVDWPPVPDDFRLPESLAEETAVPANKYHVYGDMVHGDKVGGDKTTIGNVSDGSAVAAGTEAVAVGSRGVYVTGNVYGNIHTGDVINHYITGVQTYFPQFTTAIESFFTHYLGTEKEPVPFGGRNQELAQLDNWLAQESTQRLLLVAPAGRGKSALLARWSQKFINADNPDNPAVVFMPISLRFNTNRGDNTFVILATRLAYFYGKQIPTSHANQSPQFWRGLVAEYLKEPLPNGRQLLLILDGLDEAAWNIAADLTPLNLPPTTRVVASARYLGGEEQNPTPWLRRLGWDSLSGQVETIELDRLTRDGVQDVLLKMGCPLEELGRNVDIVAGLHHLSDGDPLLLELYVKDLWEKKETAVRLKPEDLRNIKPGYKGYFAYWWEDQEKLWGASAPLEKSLVNDVLDVLAMALGPLLISDLRQLLPERVHSRALRRAIRPLNRFVIGDGKEHGFVFSHSKLNEYFRDELEVDEQVIWQTRFLTWGKQALVDLHAGRVKPEEMSQYLILHYGLHLENANANIETLLQLISLEWYKAWYKKIGSYAGFLRDIDRVWARLIKMNMVAEQEEKAPYIGQEVLCVLCNASVNSLVVNIPDDLLVLLLQYEVWTEERIITHVGLQNDLEKRCKIYSLITPWLSDKARKTVWQEIVMTARKMDDQWEKPRVLKISASYLPQEVLAATREIKDYGTQADVLLAIAREFEHSQREQILHEALAVSQKIGSERVRTKLLKAFAPSLPQEVLAMARDINKEVLRVEVFLVVAANLPESLSQAVYEEALETALKIANHKWRAQMLSQLVIFLPEDKQYPVWKDILSATLAHDADKNEEVSWLHTTPYMGNEKWSTKMLLVLADHLPEDVLSLISKIDSEQDQAKLLVTLSNRLPHDVFAVMQSLDDEWLRRYRGYVLVALAPHLPHEVLELSKRTIWYWQEKILNALVPVLPQEVLVQVEGIYEELEPDFFRREDIVKILVGLAPKLPHDVLAMVEILDNEWEREKVLVALASELPQEVLVTVQEIDWQRQDLSSVLRALATELPHEVLVEVKKIYRQKSKIQGLDYAFFHHWNNRNLINVLMAIAPKLPKEALATIEMLDDEWEQSELLAKLASELPQEVLTAAQALANERNRKKVLVALAHQLPQEVLRVGWEIKNEKHRADVIMEVIPKLPQEMKAPTLEKALVTIWKTHDGQQRTKILLPFLPDLSKARCKEVLEDALLTSQEIKDENARAKMFEAIGQYIPEAVLNAAKEFNSVSEQVEILLSLIPHLSENRQNDLWRDLLSKLQSDDHEWAQMPEMFGQDEHWQVKALVALASHHPEIVFAEVKKRYHHKLSNKELTQVLIALAPSLPQEVFEEALRITDEEERAKVLTALDSSLKQKVLMAAGNMRSEKDRAEVLVSVAQHFKESKRKAILLAVLEKAKRIEGEGKRVEVLKVLAPFLPKEVFEVARKIKDELARAEVFTSLFSFFPQEIRVLAEEMDGQGAMMMTGFFLGHEMTESLRIKISKIQGDKEYALKQVEEEIENIIERILQAARATQNEEFRAEAFKDFSIKASILPQSVLSMIWQMILLHLGQCTRPQALIDIAALMPVIYRLGGKKAVRDTFLAVQTVSIWWP